MEIALGRQAGLSSSVWYFSREQGRAGEMMRIGALVGAEWVLEQLEYKEVPALFRQSLVKIRLVGPRVFLFQARCGDSGTGKASMGAAAV